ncbi:hypothetical protein FAES_3294 [Fibrella aestuarina BUZ 2]|uniref:Uncharacterized protein n=1 Tax=Fibrella aestuarina BUZ 2 TaxID=1166018 RepID=I0KAZ9_9BACT|nr:hypothetical protein FAES_3294 [Fibrella aestuarina BUZ 2]
MAMPVFFPSMKPSNNKSPRQQLTEALLTARLSQGPGAVPPSDKLSSLLSLRSRTSKMLPKPSDNQAPEQTP